jgi:hypothetical protein
MDKKDITKNSDVIGKIKISDKKEMIEYLSLEISTILNNVISLRTKFSLTLGLGPFIIIGSFLIATGGEINGFVEGEFPIYFAIGIAICYLVILILASILDNHYAKHADNLRMTILKVSNDVEIELKDVISTDRWITQIYIFFYVSLLLAIVLIMLTLYPLVLKSVT